MAGSNNFLEFNAAKANMQSDVTYAADGSRLNGLINGIADTTLHNKLFRQASVMASAIGEAIKDAGLAASDSDVVALKAAIVNWVKSLIAVPIISDFTNANHNHTAGAGGGVLDHVNLSNKGTNTHASIDTHIAAAAPHTGHLVAHPVNTSATPAWNDHTNATGPVTVTIPTSVGNTGKQIQVRNIGTGTVTIQGTGGQTINGSATFLLYSQYDSATIESDGANLMVV